MRPRIRSILIVTAAVGVIAGQVKYYQDVFRPDRILELPPYGWLFIRLIAGFLVLGFLGWCLGRSLNAPWKSERQRPTAGGRASEEGAAPGRRW